MECRNQRTEGVEGTTRTKASKHWVFCTFKIPQGVRTRTRRTKKRSDGIFDWGFLIFDKERQAGGFSDMGRPGVGSLRGSEESIFMELDCCSLNWARTFCYKQ